MISDAGVCIRDPRVRTESRRLPDMSETKAANPSAGNDASLDAAVAELAEQAVAGGGSASMVDAAGPLDAALAATANELSEFTDAETVLGSSVTLPDAILDDRPAASPQPEESTTDPAPDAARPASGIVEPGSTAIDAAPPPADASSVPDANAEAPAEDTATVSVLSPPLESDDLADFSDPATVLSAISRDLESISPPTAVEPLAESESLVAAASEPEAVDTRDSTPLEAKPPAPERSSEHDEPAETVVAAGAAERESSPPVESHASSAVPGEAIDQLDDVLASKAEAVLEQTPDKLRVAEAAPTEPATKPAATAAAVSAAPAATAKPATARPEPAEIEPATAATPRPSAAARLKPHLVSGLARITGPLAALDGKLSHGTRQTIAWIALFTIFNATAVWGIVLVRGPAKAPEPGGQTTPFYKPGDPIPHDAGHGGGHGGGTHGADDGHGGSHGASKKSDKGGHDDGHGAKKDDHGKSTSKDKAKGKDSHGHDDKKAEKKSDTKKDSHAKADSKSKKKGKETAAAGHH